jgi:uncharacterized protein (DUF58 family)
MQSSETSTNVFRLPRAIRRWFVRGKGEVNGSSTATVDPSTDTSEPAQDAESILQRLEWTVIKRLDGLLQGDYRSLFRGFGLDLADLREYQASDDVRFIDWNVTARMNSPYVREFQEDREITAWFMVDLSASIDFGSQLRTKRSVIAQVVGVLARMLTRHGNQVGAVLYNQVLYNQARNIQTQNNKPQEAAENTTGVKPVGQRREAQDNMLNLLQGVVPPRHSRRQVLHLIDRIHAAPNSRVKSPEAREPNDQPQQLTDLAQMIEASRQAIKRRSVVLVISDFISTPGWERPLSLLAQRHEVIAIRVYDPLEVALPDLGQMTMTDPETGEQLLVDTADKHFRARFEKLASEREKRISQAMVDAGVDCLAISTQDDLAQAIIGLTELRKRRKRRA